MQSLPVVHYFYTLYLNWNCKLRSRMIVPRMFLENYEQNVREKIFVPTIFQVGGFAISAVKSSLVD